MASASDAKNTVPRLYAQKPAKCFVNHALSINFSSVRICAHYSDIQQRLPQPLDSLTLMAKVSALALINSYQSEQREILFLLNQLEHKYLGVKTKTPNEVRTKYLNEIIELIRQRLGVDNVSVFYRDDSWTKINCLATTGLWDVATGEKFSQDRINEAVYQKGEHRTWKVFESGQPSIQKAGDIAHKKPNAKYRDRDPDKVDESKISWILYPIPRLLSKAIPTDEPRCNGVIRCSGNQSIKWAQTTERSFDPVQIQTLDFIARVIGPPLETMAAQVNREMAVNYIKHDLYAPVEMISDSLSEIEKWQSDVAKQIRSFLPNQEAPQLRKYLIHDLRRALMSLEELVHRLDPDPTIIDFIEQKPASLEGDIMARLRAMLSNFASRRSGMSIRFLGFEDIPLLNIDRFLIERVFTNLIINAIKYDKRGTEILVEARAENDGFHIAVSNKGPGIEASEKYLIFKGQYRSEWARRNRMGAGLGLKISRTIMQNHGGWLEVVSLKDPTTFEFYFPRLLEVSSLDKSQN